MRNTKKQVGHKTAKNIMSAVLTALMAMSSAGSVTAVNLASVSAKTTVKKAAKKSTKKTVKKSTARTKKKTPKVYITPTSKTIYTKSSTYVYLKNNKSNVAWSASNSKISLSKKTKGSVKVYGKSAGTSYVTAKVGKKKYICKLTVKAKADTPSKPTANPSLSVTKKTIYKGDSFTLSVKNGKVSEWSAEDSGVALSDKTSTSVKVTGKVTGDTEIYARVGNKYLYCVVTVKKKVETSDPDETTYIPAHYSQAGVDAYNEMRVKYGLKPLVHNPELDEVVITRANEITVNYSHVSASKIRTKYENEHNGDSWCSLDESLSSGLYAEGGVTEEEEAGGTVAGLMLDAHRDMILSKTDLYVSAATVTKNGRTYWVFISESRGDE